jgi:hypothetical protein
VHPYDKADLRESIIAEIRRTSERLGKTPTVVEYKREKPAHGYDQIMGLFGTWNNAIAEAGLHPNPTQEPPRNDIPRDKIVDEMIRVANLLGEIPSHPKFSAKSNYSRGVVEREFGSWRNGWQQVMSEYKSRFTFQPQIRDTFKETGKRLRPLKISLPLLYEPQNEQGTLALFCLLAHDLGFKILKVQTDFPDLELQENGELHLTELEFLSSNYLLHGHPIEAKYTCICWRKDCDLGPVRIIELEGFIRDKAQIVEK